MSIRTKQRTQDRQIGLVQAALELAAQKSPAEITTAELAQAVGITQGAVFKHFQSKQAIWVAVMEAVQQDLMTRLQTEVTAHIAAGGALTALKAVFTAHIDFVLQYPGVPRLIFQELQHAKPTALKDRAQALMLAYRQLVVGLLDQARTQEHISPHIDTHAASALFMGAIQGLVMQSMMAGTLAGMKTQALKVYDIYAKGLLAPVPQPLKEVQ